MANHFIEWLYEEVTYEPPEGGTTRGEWYLYNNYSSFITKLEEKLGSVPSYSGLNFQIG